MHLRAAKRILWLCETNRGFYIKAGQFLASLQHMPKEYVATLSVLQDKVPRVLQETILSISVLHVLRWDAMYKPALKRFEVDNL